MLPPVDSLNIEQARAELARLAALLKKADTAYHTHDAPVMSDAEYDALKQRNQAIEDRFPDLKRSDSPSETIGAAPSEGFSKVTHEVAMLSLANAFDRQEIDDFDQRIRKYLGLSAETPLAYTAEPNISGAS